MRIPLFRLPLLVQIVLFGIMKLPDKIMLSTLSKRTRRLSKTIFKRLPFAIQIHLRIENIFKISLNKKEFELVLRPFRVAQLFDSTNSRILRGIYGATDGNLEAMTMNIIEFMFDVFSNLPITVYGNQIDRSAKILDAIQSCKDKYEDEKAVVKLVFTDCFRRDDTLPLLHCDQVTFRGKVSADQIFKMTVACKRVIVVNSDCQQCSNSADLRRILALWMNDSQIEYMELFFTEQKFNEAMRSVNKREVKLVGENPVGYVIRQNGGKKALVYYIASNSIYKRICLWTNFV